MPKKKNKNKGDKDGQKGSYIKEQINNCKKYLDLDLSSKSASGLLKYKFILDSLNQALELKDKENNLKKLQDLFMYINQKKLELCIENIRTKNQLKPAEKELEKAKEEYLIKNKKFQDKKKLQDLLVDKGNQKQEERKVIYDELENKRKQLVNDAENYVKELQEKTDVTVPERKQLIEENERLKNEIKRYVDESMKMKEDFDKTIKEGGLDIKDIEEQSKLGFKNTLESFQEKAQGGILLNTTLKTELLQVKQRNQELEKFKEMADKQYEKLQDEIKSKTNETVLLTKENFEIRMRITENQNKKEELLKLLTQQQADLKKINVMKSLNDKYIKQYEEITGEKIEKKKKKKRKKKNKKANKEKEEISSSTINTNETETVVKKEEESEDENDGEEEEHHCHCHECHDHH